MHEFSGGSNRGAAKMELEEFHSNKRRTLEERIFEWNVLLAL
jgi:hypothetical protein